MSFESTFEGLCEKFRILKQQLSAPETLGTQAFVVASREYSDLLPIMSLIEKYKSTQKEIAELEELVNSASTDPELRSLAKDESHIKQKLLPKLRHELQLSLLPKDRDDSRNAILEIRAGTGGEEAALFVGNLYRMYLKYAERKNWKVETINISTTGIGGYKEASFSIGGKDVFARLKFESGVHRVQRVPETESSGRLHTSAATVAVLPEVEEVDLKIDEKDLRIDVYRSSGPGGQSVNTTDSAVRITHIPTGIVVIQQDEKSQHKNKSKALKVLRARLYNLEKQKREEEISKMRKSQIGSGDRSERIRTYNFLQSRITDHRINLTSYRLDYVMKEGDLDEFIDALVADDQANKLKQITH
ncbi:peptide chain release factor 1 [Anaplasma phagocytophilum]|uniref:Peptide chain release factor 1 n=3 Tax=Anaplasma phagocytophilum TaxID=948 RepID=RF1_ANAPZ|nr:peptide chain release factor 1 [Anaplasma phagocytophilum]Q2GKS8.1 RecName: Full=Peptide chain release factor 1; Short=RF-1 [Anaplasma phagocytophilum str. HZ]KKA00789.1 peptide chain release factor 1 [Anaplasma phagocytophilum str. CR1007]ABD43237.1 peptide chain release factor 1 [Anaplasma phagocytophilum str. HZ]AGR78782.1 peptide chain release factor 1 [Anaplasma phagocytophilum str. HZ2]AGR80029.1 peptide chain release factor 1 [Anaplasma phagocytophilum str. JM]AGR81284.1 peptide cha